MTDEDSAEDTDGSLRKYKAFGRSVSRAFSPYVPYKTMLSVGRLAEQYSSLTPEEADHLSPEEKLNWQIYKLYDRLIELEPRGPEWLASDRGHDLARAVSSFSCLLY